MQVTLNLSLEALQLASRTAQQHGLSLGAAVSKIIRETIAPAQELPATQTVGRYALAPRRDESITVAHVRALVAGTD